MDQRHPLVAAQESRQADARPASQTRRSPAGQPAALPRVPAQRGTAPAIRARRSRPSPGAPRQLARMGSQVAARAIHQARAHHPPPPRRDPQHDPTRTQQRTPGRPQQPHPPDQPPKLRLPLSQPADRPHPPLLHQHRHPAPTMTFTHKLTGAPMVRRRTSRLDTGALGRNRAHRRRYATDHAAVIRAPGSCDGDMADKQWANNADAEF